MAVDENAMYYDAGGIETIKIIKAKLTREQYVGFLYGSILKYGCRANWKDNILADIDKLGTYQKLLHDALKEKVL